MYQETAHFYGFFVDCADSTNERVQLILSELTASPVTLLDIGAGNGEIAFELAKVSQVVHCLEPSFSMHSILVDRLNHKPGLHKKISVYPNKIEDIRSPINADTAYASSVLSHLNFDEKLSLMKAVRKNLKPQGIFIFNLVRQVEARPDKPLTLIGEKTIGEVTYRHYDSSQQMGSNKKKVTWKFEVESPATGLQVYEESFLLNLESDESIRVLLTESGFRKIREYGSWKKDPSDSSQPGVVLVTQLV